MSETLPSTCYIPSNESSKQENKETREDSNPELALSIDLYVGLG